MRTQPFRSEHIFGPRIFCTPFLTPSSSSCSGANDADHTNKPIPPLPTRQKVASLMSKLKVRSKNSPNIIQPQQNIDAFVDEVEILCAQILYRFQRLNFLEHALGISSMNGHFSFTCWAYTAQKGPNKGANSLVFGKQFLATLRFIVDLLHGLGNAAAKWSVADSPVILALTHTPTVCSYFHTNVMEIQGEN